MVNFNKERREGEGFFLPRPMRPKMTISLKRSRFSNVRYLELCAHTHAQSLVAPEMTHRPYLGNMEYAAIGADNGFVRMDGCSSPSLSQTLLLKDEMRPRLRPAPHSACMEPDQQDLPGGAIWPTWAFTTLYQSQDAHAKIMKTAQFNPNKACPSVSEDKCKKSEKPLSGVIWTTYIFSSSTLKLAPKQLIVFTSYERWRIRTKEILRDQMKPIEK